MTFISYAQNLEDVMLFRALKHVERGFYIDVGAMDPVKASVTKAFYDRGWRGINIEPLDEYFRLLEEERKEDTNVKLVLSNRQGEVVFNKVLSELGMSTIHKAYADDHAKDGREIVSVTVPCTTLDDICEKYDLKTVHFLKIDVEGAEREVLEGFSFERVRPWIAVIEANKPYSTKDASQAWEPIILERDYRLVYYDGLNRYYLAEEHSDLQDCFRVPPNFFDDYILYSHWLAEEGKKNLQQQLSEKKAIEAYLQEQVKQIEDSVGEKEAQISQLRSRVSELEIQLSQIQSGIVMRLLRPYAYFIKKLAPYGTRRRLRYELVLTGIRVILNEGFRSFFKKVRFWFRLRKTTPPKTRLSLPKFIPSISRKEVENLKFPTPVQRPLVSIIMPVYNKWKYTLNCLKSVCENTEDNYEIIIVDDASTDDTVNILERIENLRLLKNEYNAGFVESCNRGAKASKGDYLLFLNNDTIVTKNWLQPMLKLIERQDVGAVGSKLVYADGTLQEAGSIIWNDGSALGYGRGDDPQKPEYNYVREVDYCTGACLLVKRDLFEKLKGFDERFKPGYYEDSDFCLSVKKLGYKVMYQPMSVVVHFEGITHGTDVNSGIKRYQRINKPKFVEKWNDVLLRNHFPPTAENIVLARSRPAGKRVLVVDDRIPTPSQGSGYPRAHSMLEFICELGYSATFFPIDSTIPWQPYTSEFQQSGIEVFYGEGLDFTSFAEARAGYYDLVLISRPHNMEKAYSIIKKRFPKAALLYDAEAMFSMRELLKARLHNDKKYEKDALRKMDKEIGLMNSADTVIMVSHAEKALVSSKIGGNNITIWAHALPVQEPKTPFRERKDVLFVGGFLGLDSPNEDAILYFSREIFPDVAEDLSCRLVIAGANTPGSVKKLSSSSIIVAGFVEDLTEYYEKCRIFIVPHRYSAGIPLKLLEAMNYGIPSVVSELSASQLRLTDGKEVLVAGNARDFRQKVKTLYEDEKLWYHIQSNALAYVRENCDQKRLRRMLRAILEGAMRYRHK